MFRPQQHTKPDAGVFLLCVPVRLSPLTRIEHLKWLMVTDL